MRNESSFHFLSSMMLFLICIMVAPGCSTKEKEGKSIELMPAPAVYIEDIDEFEETPVLPGEILYATNRLPATEGKLAYESERGGLLRFGSATIRMGEGNFSWEEAKQISLLKNRSEKYPLKIDTVTESGVLGSSLNRFVAPDVDLEMLESTGAEFASSINAHLENTRSNDVYIYVHGYKVDFNNPLLVATEMWHFLGYDGVFIAYSWPSTPSRMAYLADLETTELSSYHFRALLEFIAKNTTAERIHIVGYSAGNRIVLRSLHQLALVNRFLTPEARKQHKIGRVMIIGSDMDGDIFSSQIREGMLDMVDNMSVYISDEDRAIDLAQWLFKWNRIGRGVKGMPEPSKTFITENSNLQLIDVSHADNAKKGNGHSYFRSSPWVSSDILMSLKHGLSPEDRGLVIDDQFTFWEFPEDYPQRLTSSLKGLRTP